MRSSMLDRYMEPLLAGNRTACRDLVQGQISNNKAGREIYEELLWPAMERIERLFRKDRINTAVEHMATRINRSLADQIQQALEVLFPSKPVGYSRSRRAGTAAGQGQNGPDKRHGRDHIYRVCDADDRLRANQKRHWRPSGRPGLRSHILLRSAALLCRVFPGGRSCHIPDGRSRRRASAGRGHSAGRRNKRGLCRRVSDDNDNRRGAVTMPLLPEAPPKGFDIG